MRLQVAHQLQAVLDAAQESVGVLQYPVFLIGQAPGMSQCLRRLERIALANLGEIAAVEQLQKLNSKFHIADAADARFDLDVASSITVRFLLDATLQSLDAVDFAKGQV